MNPPNAGLLMRWREESRIAIVHHAVMSTQNQTSKIQVGNVDPRGYNCAPQAMTRADNPKCRNKALAAVNRVCIGAVIGSLFAGPLLTTKLGVTISNGRHASALENPISDHLPGCIAESPFFKSLPKGFRWPDPGDALSLRVLEEYGALFVARGGVVLPPVVIFPDQNAVAHWQSNLSIEQAEFGRRPGETPERRDAGLDESPRRSISGSC